MGMLGIVANALLFVGDLGTGESTQPVVAAIVGVGYLLLLVWFAVLGASLIGWSRTRGRRRPT
jgi:hypothetical protein